MTRHHDDPSNLSPDDFNVRRDLFAFMEYVAKRGIQRSHRANEIPPGDRKRLTKILGVPRLLLDTEEDLGTWAEWICALARQMGFVSYDIKGQYLGYSSQEPSFPENHIEIDRAGWETFLALPSSAKERKIVAVLVKHNKNEFYEPSLLGTQGRFDGSGSAVGAASRMNLPHVRKRLLEILGTYTPGQPVPFGDFVGRIRSEEPNLIIDHLRKPEKPDAPLPNRKGAFVPPVDARPPRPVYEYLHEIAMNEEKGIWHQDWSKRKEIGAHEPNSFMRVEGRYLAYFLEEIPLLMHFVRLEYGKDETSSRISPPLPDFIHSFTVSDKLASVLNPNDTHLDRVNVTITPDFKVIVDAPLYPDRELAVLAPYTEIKSADKHITILTLGRNKTVETLTANPKTKPISHALRELVSTIPQNVAADILEWTNHAEKLAVYENAGLLEIRDDRPEAYRATLTALGAAINRTISPKIYLLENPEKVYRRLEQLEQVPGRIPHRDQHLHESLLNRAGGAKTRTPIIRPTAEERQKISLAESSLLGFKSDNVDFLRGLLAHLKEAGVVPVFFDESEGMIAVPYTARPRVNAFIKRKRIDCVGYPPK